MFTLDQQMVVIQALAGYIRTNTSTKGIADYVSTLLNNVRLTTLSMYVITI